MATLPNPLNTDLSRGFTVSKVAEKHKWTEPMVWSLALEDKKTNNLNMPYYFLGPGAYVSHDGSRPMSIIGRLKYPLPGKLIRTTERLAIV